MSRGEVFAKKNRKTRSDKKRDVKPTVSVELKNCIYRLSYVTDTAVKDVVEIFCEKGLKSRRVIDYLSQFFRREYEFKSTIYMGNLERESLQRKYQSKYNERITTRFTQFFYDEISKLAYALDVTPSKATALLLDASVRNTHLLDAFVKTHLHKHIDKNRMRELKQVLNYINSNNPYSEELSWFALLSLIYDEIRDGTQNIKVIIGNWMDKNKNHPV